MFHGKRGFGRHSQQQFVINVPFPEHNAENERFYDLKQLNQKIEDAPNVKKEYEELLDRELARTTAWLDTQRQAFKMEMNTRVDRWKALKDTKVRFEERKEANKLNITYRDEDTPWRVLLDGRDIFSVVFSFLSASELCGSVSLVCFDFLSIVQENVSLNVDIPSTVLQRYPMDAILGKCKIERLRIHSPRRQAHGRMYYHHAQPAPGDKVLSLVQDSARHNPKLKSICISCQTQYYYNHYHNNQQRQVQQVFTSLHMYPSASSIEDLEFSIPGVPQKLHKFTNLQRLSLNISSNQNNRPYFGHQQQNTISGDDATQMVDYIASSKTLKQLSLTNINFKDDIAERLVDAVRINNKIQKLIFIPPTAPNVYRHFGRNTNQQRTTDADEDCEAINGLMDYITSEKCALQSLSIKNNTTSHTYAYGHMTNQAPWRVLERLSDNFETISPSIKEISVFVPSLDNYTAWNLLCIPNIRLTMTSEFTQGNIVKDYLNSLEPSGVNVSALRINEFQFIMTISKLAADKFIGSNIASLEELTLGCFRARFNTTIPYVLETLQKNTHLKSLTLCSSQNVAKSNIILDQVANLIHQGHPTLEELNFRLQHSDEYAPLYRRKRVSHDSIPDESDSDTHKEIVKDIVSYLKDPTCKIKRLHLGWDFGEINSRFEAAIMERMFSEEGEEESSQQIQDVKESQDDANSSQRGTKRKRSDNADDVDTKRQKTE